MSAFTKHAFYRVKDKIIGVLSPTHGLSAGTVAQRTEEDERFVVAALSCLADIGYVEIDKREHGVLYRLTKVGVHEQQSTGCYGQLI